MVPDGGEGPYRGEGFGKEKAAQMSGRRFTLRGGSEPPIHVVNDWIPPLSMNRAGRIRNQLTVSRLTVLRVGPLAPQQHPAGAILSLTLGGERSGWDFSGRPRRSFFRRPGSSVSALHAHTSICHSFDLKAMAWAGGRGRRRRKSDRRGKDARPTSLRFSS